METQVIKTKVELEFKKANDELTLAIIADETCNTLHSKKIRAICVLEWKRACADWNREQAVLMFGEKVVSIEWTNVHKVDRDIYCDARR